MASIFELHMALDTSLAQVRCLDIELNGFHCKYLTNDATGRIPDDVLQRMTDWTMENNK